MKLVDRNSTYLGGSSSDEGTGIAVDSGGNDLSSSSITVHAISVTQISTFASGAVENAGNSNPDNDFRFDATLGSTGGYIFNLKTTGLSTGMYKVNFTVTGDSFVYAANFEIK